mmetsp:Transcript_48/g.123  ORF Transcript_48/g.123 Transcript_48/m.123 type:complete len:554 (-) Transcript_48:395-2056(-)
MVTKIEHDCPEGWGDHAPTRMQWEIEWEKHWLHRYARNVCKRGDLEHVGAENLSGEPERPLQSINVCGSMHQYSLKPFLYSVWTVLFCLLTLTWSSSEALSVYTVSASDATWTNQLPESFPHTISLLRPIGLYLGPILGGMLADVFLGGYVTILVVFWALMFPSLVISTVLAYPFPASTTLPLGLAISGISLSEIATSSLQVCLVGFGAAQFCPGLQSVQLQLYFIMMYVALSTGRMLSTFFIPVFSSSSTMSLFLGNTLGLCFAMGGFVTFIIFRKRYAALPGTLQYKPNAKYHFVSRISPTNRMSMSRIAKTLANILLLSCTTIPFNIVQMEMGSVFRSQRSLMRMVGHGEWFSTIRPILVILAGLFIGFVVNPALRKLDINMHPTHRLAIGTFIGAVSMLASIALDYGIHTYYLESGKTMSELWQLVPRFILALGEVFLHVYLFELTFRLSPHGFKNLGLAISYSVHLPSKYISRELVRACGQWEDSLGVNQTPGVKVETHVYNVFWVMFGICVCATILLFLPWVKRLYDKIENESIRINHLVPSVPPNP